MTYQTVPATPLEIVLIDDDDEDVYLTQEAVKASGKPVTFRRFDSGVEACNFFDNEDPALARKTKRIVLLDINMPDIAGLEVLQNLKSHSKTRPIPVIIYSTSQHSQDVSKAYQLGANSYLVKPLQFNAAVELMLKLQNYWAEAVHFKANI